MTRGELLKFLQSGSLAVQASVSASGRPQAAVLAFALADDFSFVFDSVIANRKVGNLRRNSHVALVVGGLTNGDERTAQIEGIADEPSGLELERRKEIYFARFPDGRERQKWPGIVYMRVRPTWIRFSDYHHRPPKIIEFDFLDDSAKS